MKKRFISIISILLLFTLLFLQSCKNKNDNVNLVTDNTAATTSEQEEVPVVITEESLKFDEFVDDLFLNQISLDTFSLHYSVKDTSVYGLENAEARWEATEEEDRYPLDKIIETLNSFDYDKLNEDRKITFKVLKDYCDLQKQFEDERFTYMESYFDIGSGVQTAIPTNFFEYDLFCEKDIKDLIRLIELLPDFVQGLLDTEQERVDAGFGYYDRIIDQIIDQCKEIYDTDETFYLYGAMEDKINSVDFLSQEQKDSYIKQVNEAIEAYMIPTYKKIADTFETFKGKSKNDKGLAGFEGGVDYYALIVKYATGSSKTLEELYNLLSSDFAKNYDVLRNLYTNYKKAYDAYYLGNGYIPMTDPVEILEYLRGHMYDDFPKITGESYKIRYLSKEMEKVLSSTVAYYVVPQIDNYLEGKIAINGAALDESESFTTLAHEGFPGHMYQTVYYYNTNPPKMRQILNFGGYTEGWAVYVQNYVYDLYDFPKNDYAFDSLAKVNFNLSWNLMCMADIGVNYKGWTVEDLATYMDDQGFNSEGAESLYDFVVSSPTTYLKYYIGYLEFLELKNYAQTKLLTKFDNIGFHKACLDAGPSNFDVVKIYVDEYINKVKSGK